MNKEKNPLSIKMSEEEKAIIKHAATDHGETWYVICWTVQQKR